MDSRELDVRHLGNLALPYDTETKELAEGARIVAGNNTYITKGGKIAQAPGLTDSGLTSYTITGRVDRIISYETAESTPITYLLASVYTGSVWVVKYCRVGTTTWTTITSLRNVNNSIAAHEFSIARGKVYIKCFPGTERYGTVIFNGTGGSVSVTSWGIEGPTGLPVTTNIASAATTVWRFGYRYAYAYYNSVTGQVSNRSQASVRNAPAGPTVTPRVAMTYSTDATVTHINVYRTIDGGGTLYYIGQFANVTSGGAVNYDDNSVGGEPVLDATLDTRNIAPSEISNWMPPSQIAYADLGALFTHWSPIAYFARRHWFGMANKIFYSGQEEISNGVPEECFPGAFSNSGNHYTIQGQVRQIQAAKRAVYITTSNGVMILGGQDNTNFLIDTHIPDIAGAFIPIPGNAGHAITAFRDSVFFLSADQQIYSMTGADPPELISGPLGTDFRDYLDLEGGSNALRVEFEIYSRTGHTWLIVNCSVVTDSTLNRQYVYDLERKIWFTPWQKPISAMVFGKLQGGGDGRDLIVTTYNGTTSKLAILSFTTVADVGTNFVPSATIALATLPAGNHINELRKWAHSPMLAFIILERTKFASDSEPTVTYRLDEFSGSATTAAATDPPYIAQHASYYEKWYSIQLVCKRVQLIITGTGGQKLEIQNIAFAFQSEAGA